MSGRLALAIGSGIAAGLLLAVLFVQYRSPELALVWLNGFLGCS